MPKIANLVHETTLDTGTGPYALSLENGKQRFSDAFGTGDTGQNKFFAFMSNPAALEYMWFEGSLDPADTGGHTLRVDTPISGSAGAGVQVSFGAGSKDIVVDSPASYQAPRYQDTGKPDNAIDNTTWTRTTDGKKFELYDDGTTKQWIQATSGGGGSYDYTLANGLTSPINVGLSVDADTSTAGDMTITLTGANGSALSSTNRARIPFRNVTETNGSLTWLDISSAVTLEVSSGSTLGVTAAEAFRLWVVVFNDGGTARLGVINCFAGSDAAGDVDNIYALTDWAVKSSTAEGGAGAADSAGVIYTDSAVTNKAMRILGFIEFDTSGLTTAGDWDATDFTNELLRVQMFGPGVPLPNQVIQEVYAAHSTVASTTSSTYVSTGDTVSVTPTSAANVVKVRANGTLYSSGSSDRGELQLSRGTTNNTNMIGTVGATFSLGASLFAPVSVEAADKPNTTSTQSYAVQIQRAAGTASTVRWLTNNTAGFVVAQEIMV